MITIVTLIATHLALGLLESIQAGSLIGSKDLLGTLGTPSGCALFYLRRLASIEGLDPLQAPSHPPRGTGADVENATTYRRSAAGVCLLNGDH